MLRLKSIPDSTFYRYFLLPINEKWRAYNFKNGKGDKWHWRSAQQYNGKQPANSTQKNTDPNKPENLGLPVDGSDNTEKKNAQTKPHAAEKS